MATRRFIPTIMLSAGLLITGCSNQAGATDAQGSTEVGTIASSSNPITASIEPLTIVQLRAAQKDIETQIQELESKGNLPRVDKIALLKLKRKLLALEKSETKIQEETIRNYDAALRNLAEIKGKIQD